MWSRKLAHQQLLVLDLSSDCRLVQRAESASWDVEVCIQAILRGADTTPKGINGQLMEGALKLWPSCFLLLLLPLVPCVVRYCQRAAIINRLVRMLADQRKVLLSASRVVGSGIPPISLRRVRQIQKSQAFLGVWN